MELSKMLAELHAEVERLNEAIAIIENLIHTGRKRRGRPPKWLVAKRVEQEMHQPPADVDAAGED